MNAQIDLFADGSADSVPDHKNPEKVDRVTVDVETDRDHVGESAIGRVGNNSSNSIVRIWGKCGTVLHAERFPVKRNRWGETRNGSAAMDRASALRGEIRMNGQARLF